MKFVKILYEFLPPPTPLPRILIRPCQQSHDISTYPLPTPSSDLPCGNIEILDISIGMTHQGDAEVVEAFLNPRVGTDFCYWCGGCSSSAVNGIDGREEGVVSISYSILTTRRQRLVTSSGVYGR